MFYGGLVSGMLWYAWEGGQSMGSVTVRTHSHRSLIQSVNGGDGGEWSGPGRACSAIVLSSVLPRRTPHSQSRSTCL